MPVYELLPPLHLAYVAGLLRANDFDVSIIDCIAEELSPEDMFARINKISPDLIVSSTCTPTFVSDVQMTRRIKENFPEVKICLFGTHVSVLPYEALRDKSVDFVAIGEAEKTVLELCQKLEEDGKNLSGVKGLGWKNGDEIKINEKRELIKNLDELPYPARDLLPNVQYRPVIYKKLPFTTVYSSRGCPYDCIFCGSSIMFEKVWRPRSPENVVAEVKHVMDDFGVKEIFFNDDIFTMSKARTKKICQLLKELDSGMIWGCESRVDTLDKEMLDAMSEAGCYKITFGTESGSQFILDKMKKKVTVDQIRDVFKATKDAGIQANASFLMGMPWDTKETIMETIEFAKEIEPNHVQFCVATPFPGTELYEVAKEEGCLMGEDWEMYDLHSPEGGVCRTKTLSIEDLSYYLKKAYKEFYFRPKRLLKALLEIRSPRQLYQYIRVGSTLLFE
ncbi:MAG: radical SAM protein [Methanocellales archaeon]|nr:radical SAM protein [Methanocellales archaeon]